MSRRRLMVNRSGENFQRGGLGEAALPKRKRTWVQRSIGRAAPTWSGLAPTEDWIGVFMIRKFANLLILEILSPLQGWATFNVVSRADALRFIFPPRWGG